MFMDVLAISDMLSAMSSSAQRSRTRSSSVNSSEVSYTTADSGNADESDIANGELTEMSTVRCFHAENTTNSRLSSGVRVVLEDGVR